MKAVAMLELIREHRSVQDAEHMSRPTDIYHIPTSDGSEDIVLNYYEHSGFYIDKSYKGNTSLEYMGKDVFVTLERLPKNAVVSQEIKDEMQASIRQCCVRHQQPIHQQFRIDDKRRIEIAFMPSRDTFYASIGRKESSENTVDLTNEDGVPTIEDVIQRVPFEIPESVKRNLSLDFEENKKWKYWNRKDEQKIIETLPGIEDNTKIHVYYASDRDDLTWTISRQGENIESAGGSPTGRQTVEAFAREVAPYATLTAAKERSLRENLSEIRRQNGFETTYSLEMAPSAKEHKSVEMTLFVGCSTGDGEYFTAMLPAVLPSEEKSRVFFGLQSVEEVLEVNKHEFVMPDHVRKCLEDDQKFFRGEHKIEHPASNEHVNEGGR